MPTNLPTNLPTIMQAVETWLTTYVSPITNNVIAGDASNIYHVMAGDEPKPGTTGQRDILLIERSDDTEKTVEGAGRFALIYSGLDVNLRSSLSSDRFGTRKDFLLAHSNLVDGLRDALMGFFPEDANRNGLTIEGFVLDESASPVKNRDSLNWGQTVATYRFHYVPKIHTARLA